MSEVNAGDASFEFSKEEIKSRIYDHWELADDFITEFASLYGVSNDDARIVVSQRRLALATDSAYQDIARYKNYHLKNPAKAKLDCVKRCAYLVKWILKFKPLMVVGCDGLDPKNTDHNVDNLELANEFFCIYLFEVHLSDEVGFDVGLSVKKGKDLAYDLLYRGITPSGWIAVFQIFKDCVFPKYCEDTPFIVKI